MLLAVVLKVVISSRRQNKEKGTKTEMIKRKAGKTIATGEAALVSRPLGVLIGSWGSIGGTTGEVLIFGENFSSCSVDSQGAGGR